MRSICASGSAGKEGLGNSVNWQIRVKACP